ncbi:beta-lactamase/transpeptidase-like protein [Athelia psychrophila]|uniref:Beta-lactamase/transpeptidase-like protein n=1 Tax=Athelia psychrophila TaxID=1759441 RepID=A0A166H0M7_9AGAM|nr:beta-lactamase/transpeptidase-like protein [Fibularhizoctonia sp. CBS 109695]
MSADDFEKIIRNAIDKGVIPGCVVVATNKSGTLNYSKAFGKAGVLPDSKPLNLQSTFWIASCTKLMTAVAAMQCVEKGLLSLESPEDVARLLPEYAAPDILTGFDDEGKPILTPAKNRITLRQLLTHSSGMGYDFSSPQLIAWRKSRNEEKAAFIMDIQGYVTPLLYEPGEGWEYGAGADWAGQMVERASGGLTLNAYMEKNIWQPLNIKHIAFHLETNEEVKRHLVNVSARVPDTGLLVHYPRPLISDPAKDSLGGGGAYGSPIEYLRVLGSLLRDDGKLLQSASIDELFRPQLSETSKRAWMQHTPDGNIPVGTDVSWGLGGMTTLEDVDGRRRKGSVAWGGMPNLFWWMDRETGVAGVYASQIIPPGDMQSNELFEAFERHVYNMVGGSQ